jgi:lysozyme
MKARWKSTAIGPSDGVNPQTWNRYAYVLNNPLSATDPLGLFCVWDNGSFDSNDDPDTGSQAQCEGNGPNGGGTWFNGNPSGWVDSSGNQVFGSNDWSGDPNAEAAALAQGINPSVGNFGNPTGTPDAAVFAPFIPVPMIASPMGASNSLLRFLATCEGFSATAYADSRGNCTIGYGHLLHMGPCTATDNKLSVTQQSAMNQLTADVNTAATALNSNLTVPLNQGQFDSMVSLTFNMGMNRLQTHDVWSDVNAGNMAAVPGDIKSLGAGGPGIPARRANEANMFQNGVYANACYSW